MNKLIAIQRHASFSPNSVERDRQILEAVCQRSEMAYEIVQERDGMTLPDSAIVLTMGRLDSTLDLLDDATARGTRVINRSEAVRRCARTTIQKLMHDNHLPVPPESGSQGVWLKRGDRAAQEREDVVFCADAREMAQAMARFRERGLQDTDIVHSAHIAGDLVKFYGVTGGFFYTCYPSEKGISKFGDEARNGDAMHYNYDREALRRDAFALAQLVGIDVWGGDAIVTARGDYYIIDFNDWPSFSPCRDAAAEAIVKLFKTL